MKQLKPILNFRVSVKRVKEDSYLVMGQDAWKVNEVAEKICLLCNGKNKIEDILEKISGIYEMQIDEIEDECLKLIDFLMNEKVLSV